MGWAIEYIKQLKDGKEISFRPRGNSMQGKIESGQLVTLTPIKEPPVVGDVVLCKVNGREFLHLVRAIRDDQFQIGNNKGFINGWTSLKNIFGKCIKIEQ